MRNGATILGLVPARGGSKGIPQKNRVQLAGKPLLAWTLEAARQSGMFERLIVSTDAQEIAALASAYGAEVPFLRPESLARDDTPLIDAVVQALQWLIEQEAYRADYVMVMQPTSPLRTAEDIQAAIALAQQSRADSVVSVCAVEHHPAWMKRLDAEGRLLDYEPDQPFTSRRQDLVPLYTMNGAIYLTRSAVVLAERTCFPADTRAYVMPAERSLDIDSPWSLHLAELVLQYREQHASFSHQP